MNKTTKKTPYCSDDLRVNKGLNVKVKTIDINNPNVIEIGLSLYAVPKETKKEDEYIESIETIKKKVGKIFKGYISQNKDIFKDKVIIDFSFSSANLKKGYNKYATMSFYVQQSNLLQVSKLKNKIKSTIKDCSFQITSTIQEEGFSCYKTKHKQSH